MMVKVTEPNSFIAWKFDFIVREVLFCFLQAKSANIKTAAASASKISIVGKPQNYCEGESIQVSISISYECIMWLHYRVATSAPRPVLITYSGLSLQLIQYLPGENPITKQPTWHYQEMIGCEEFK